MNVGDCSLHRCYWLKLDLAFRHFDFSYFIELTPRWLHFTTLVTFKWTIGRNPFRGENIYHERKYLIFKRGSQNVKPVYQGHG